jgi:hypothetical protein
MIPKRLQEIVEVLGEILKLLRAQQEQQRGGAEKSGRSTR